MNITHAHLLATRTPVTISFSGAVTNQSVYLPGPGTQAADGYPLPRRGILTSLKVWDGATLRSDTEEISFNAGDRVALFCQATGVDFGLKVRVNGNSTNLQVAGIPYNRSLLATVELLLIRD